MGCSGAFGPIAGALTWMLPLMGQVLFGPKSLQAQQVVIPVVFHVLHDNGPENILDEQIFDHLELLNQAFGEYPTVAIEPTFEGIVASVDLAFCLATIAPDGDPTDGIDRIETTLAFEGGSPDSYLNQWPPDRYLNVWVVGGMASSGPIVMALLPGEAELEPWRDGVMLRHDLVGRWGTGSLMMARGTIPYFGRYFNLKWMCEDPTGQEDCGDDEVMDTPPCHSLVTCVVGEESCLPGIPVNAQNYMVHTYCMSMFTQGQRDRVHACLNSDVAQRNGLWSPTNLEATGCLGQVGIQAMSVAERPTFGPNPFHEALFITGLGPGLWTLEFVDPLGRSIMVDQVSSTGDGSIQVDGLGGLSLGVHMLRITDGQRVHSAPVVRAGPW